MLLYMWPRLLLLLLILAPNDVTGPSENTTAHAPKRVPRVSCTCKQSPCDVSNPSKNDVTVSSESFQTVQSSDYKNAHSSGDHEEHWALKTSGSYKIRLEIYSKLGTDCQDKSVVIVYDNGDSPSGRYLNLCRSNSGPSHVTETAMYVVYRTCDGSGSEGILLRYKRVSGSSSSTKFSVSTSSSSSTRTKSRTSSRSHSRSRLGHGSRRSHGSWSSTYWWAVLLIVIGIISCIGCLIFVVIQTGKSNRSVTRPALAGTDYPGQSYNTPQPYPSQTFVPQPYPPQPYPPQPYPPQPYPPQNYPPQSYPPQSYPPQNYPPQNSPTPGYPPPNYAPPAYPAP